MFSSLDIKTVKIHVYNKIEIHAYCTLYLHDSPKRRYILDLFCLRKCKNVQFLWDMKEKIYIICSSTTKILEISTMDSMSNIRFRQQHTQFRLFVVWPVYELIHTSSECSGLHPSPVCTNCLSSAPLPFSMFKCYYPQSTPLIHSPYNSHHPHSQ